MPTDEQRALYVQTKASLAAAELSIKGAKAGLLEEIAELEGPVVTPLQEALAGIVEEIGEPFDSCIFCETPLFDDDDTASGEDGDHACRPCADRWRAETPDLAAEVDAARGEEI